MSDICWSFHFACQGKRSTEENGRIMLKEEGQWQKAKEENIFAFSKEQVIPMPTT